MDALADVIVIFSDSSSPKIDVSRMVYDSLRADRFILGIVTCLEMAAIRDHCSRLSIGPLSQWFHSGTDAPWLASVFGVEFYRTI